MIAGRENGVWLKVREGFGGLLWTRRCIFEFRRRRLVACATKLVLPLVVLERLCCASRWGRRCSGRRSWSALRFISHTRRFVKSSLQGEWPETLLKKLWAVKPLPHFHSPSRHRSLSPWSHSFCTLPFIKSRYGHLFVSLDRPFPFYAPCRNSETFYIIGALRDILRDHCRNVPHVVGFSVV